MAKAEPVRVASRAGVQPRDLTAHYRALADATRLRILRELWQRSGSTVTDLCHELRISQPLMSWHLRILRRAGIVTTYRTGRQVHCAVAHDVIEDNGRLMETFLASSADIQETKIPASKRKEMNEEIPSPTTA